MNAIVVYESLWGNTANFARAIAEGIGPSARALSTADATRDVVAGADLIVAGAPLMQFMLPTDEARQNLAQRGQAGQPFPPDLSKPSMRNWLKGLPRGKCAFAAFETRIRLTLGDVTKSIGKEMEGLGYHQIVKGEQFMLKGIFGPPKDGEMERAKAWGASLAKSVG